MDHETIELIQDQIFSVHGQQVILDSELASLYGVETGALNQAVSRNKDRFPADFCFQLSKSAWENLRCQIGISSKQNTNLISQNVISSGHGGRRSLPRVFTENETLMAQLSNQTTILKQQCLTN